ncbi:S-adenosyl-L-methionine-dependent methyltransferase [Gonapodya prolifera JEL478]|uniref:S-adenosyl-L-methionine-dependent methyltransferase n=1 Tax=Gonapodya prolifera (strain JEL478) TaxID=1344416 RepID=A0A139AUB1_GONPJ|nr:S-adenosyl-L-methionine-dependent methyltransferase [Gonapodya prolifera JEL478]|eukprot:KXS20297.1 S-adenosyl-L-methionine-dependent methyltransferase [Gonapodya prolifera JEL478]
MGKQFRKGGRGRGGRRQRDREGGAGTEGKSGNYKSDEWSSKLENERFEAYYKTQNILPDDEWPKFMESLRTTLPTTFRITGSRKVSAGLRDAMIREHIPNLREAEVDGEKGNISRQEAVSMIPPLLLDVQPHHIVFDMCAAPGSKTAQIIEAIHAEEGFVSGLVVANDADNARSHMLVRQTKRLQSEALLVTNHQAQMMPNMFIRERRRHTAQEQAHLAQVDRRQRSRAPPVQILRRGCQLLRVGGRLVYSTCSFNPIENEAVVAELLRIADGSFELLDVSAELPGLIRRPGLTSWKVVSIKGNSYDSYDSVPPAERTKLQPSMFSTGVTEGMNMDRCLRLYPHLQDTGGFFVAVLQKVKPFNPDLSAAQTPPVTTTTDADAPVEEEVKDVDNDADMEESLEPPSKKRRTDDASEADEADDEVAAEDDATGDLAEEGAGDGDGDGDADSDGDKKGKRRQRQGGEDPVVLVDAGNKELESLRSQFGISDEFPKDQFIVRTTNEVFKTLYFVSSTSKRVLAPPENGRVKFVHAGVKAFVRCDAARNNLYRVQSDGLRVTFPFLGDGRVVKATQREDLLALLQKEYPLFTDFTETVRTKLQKMDEGCAVIVYDPDVELGTAERRLYHVLMIPLWRAKVSVNLLLNKAEKQSLLWQLTGSLQAEEEKRRRRIENGRDAQTGRMPEPTPSNA